MSSSSRSAGTRSAVPSPPPHFTLGWAGPQPGRRGAAAAATARRRHQPPAFAPTEVEVSSYLVAALEDSGQWHRIIRHKLPAGGSSSSVELWPAPRSAPPQQSAAAGGGALLGRRLLRLRRPQPLPAPPEGSPLAETFALLETLPGHLRDHILLLADAQARLDAFSPEPLDVRQLVWRHYEVSRVGRTHRALAAATPYHAVLPATPMSTPKLRGCMAWLRRLQLASLDIRAPLSQQRLTLMLQPLAELAPQHAGVLQPLRGLSTLHLHQFQSALLAGLPRSTTAVCMSLPGHGLEDSWVVPALGTVQPLASMPSHCLRSLQLSGPLASQAGNGMGGLDVALYAEALFSSATSLGISVCRLTLELPPQPAVECCSQPQPSLLHRLFPRALCRQRQVGAQQSASSGEGGEADVLLGELLDCFEGSGSCCKFAALGCTTLLLAPAPSGGAEEAAPAVSAAAASQHSGPTNSAAHGAGVPASTCTPQLVATLQKQRLRRSMAALAGRVSGMNAAQPPQPGLVLGRRDATLSVLELKQRRPRAFVPARLAVRLARAAMAATKWVFAELAASGALHFLASYLVLRLFKAWAAG